MALINRPPNNAVDANGGSITNGWATFFSAVFRLLTGITAAGPTSARPLASPQTLRWVGMPYYDTTLGKPIWLDSVAPDIWHDASGAPV